MKFKTTVNSPRCLKVKKKKHGFALIATLTLMMLLTMLAVGILAMASTQNRIAMQTVLQSEARQQALVGLDAAIGELQMELGPDRRITASSSILADNDGSITQHLLGVWDSWDGPIYGKSASGKGKKISETYDKGRTKMFRRWMVSSINPQEVKTFSAANSLGKRNPGTRVCLVGEGTLGKRFRSTHHIYADLLTMPASGENSGCFAWWVGGENQKSKISVQNPESTKDVIEILHRTWDTPAPTFVDSEYVDFLPDEIKDPDKLLTMASLPLLNTASQDAGMPYFFDITTHSYTLPVNVRDGGLKQDINLLLNKKSLKGTEYVARSTQDCPIAENDDIPTGTEKDMPIGSWQNLHAYYNCWPDGSAADEDFGTRLGGNVANAYTRMAGTLLARDGTQTYYDSRADLDNKAGYARVPVMLAFMSNFGLVTSGTTLKSGQAAGNMDMGMCFSPMVLWWNPYNVPMKIRSNCLWAQSVPYKCVWLQTFANTVKNDYNTVYKWGTYAMHQTYDDTGFGLDYGNYFMHGVGSDTADIEFDPGEIIFFSPGVARLTGDYTVPYSNPWVEGYNPTNVAAYKARFYSNKAVSLIEAGTFHVGIRFGVNRDGSGSYNSDGYWFSPGHIECFTVFSGYGGMGAANSASGGGGKYGQSPQRFLMGWYDPNDASLNTEICDATWEMEGQDDPTSPYFIAAVGITAKSANRQMDTTLFIDADYRAKIWQHSSPAFWGSMIMLPDDQQRQYHPYQFASLKVGTGAASAPMDNIGRNGMLGITSDGEQVSFASVLELPVHPPFSLAGFAGMRLQPGWYQAGSGGVGVSSLRRMQYQSGVPGVGIGNSFADPCLPAADVYYFFSGNKIPTSVDGNSRVFGDFYDHGLLINDALWDKWFCSSISDMPKRGGGKIDAKETLQKFLAGSEPLPVSRYKRTSTPYRDADIVARVLGDDGWKYIAQYLTIDGGFNINSTSEDAWASVLQGLADRKLVCNVKSSSLSEVEPDKSKSSVLFSRFMVSTTDKSLDSLGGYSALQGDSTLRKGKTSELAAWGEVRRLDSDTIRELAKQIVKQVRKRGPFLSMSDFINRRLDSSDETSSLTGALQAAIDAAGINDDFNDEKVTAQKQGSLYQFTKAAEGSLYTAAPGYLIQSDVLASLGNVLTVRDDTFTVRAYGCVRSRNRAILAQAWCEAVVQRTVDYVDPTNAATDVDSKGSDSSAKNTSLTELNKVMGRKFRIVSFKWLDAWDI